MTSTSRLRTALLAAVLVAGLAACAGPADDAGAPGQVAGEGPARPPAGGEELVVDEQPLEAPVVLDPVPDGLLLTGLSYDPAPQLVANQSSGSYEPSRATLYGDPALADSLDGPVLLVGTSSGSATIAGPGYDAPGEQVDLGGGRTGRVVRDTDRTWVLVDGNDYREFVVGRGIDEEDLVAAARTADFASATAALAPDVVPDGLAPLVVGSPQDRPGSGAWEAMTLQGEASYVFVSVVRADPRLAALWGFWLEDATGTLVRGQPGSAGDLQGANVGDPDARGRVWAEDGLVLSVVVTQGPDRGSAAPDRDDLLDRVVEALRIGTWAEFEALDGEIRTRPPTAVESPCPSTTGFVSGVQGESRWIFQLQPNPYSSSGEWSACSFDLTSGGGSGGSVSPPPLGELAVSGSGSGVVGGVAPPGTARVTVTGADGSTLEAVLAADGPRPGERVWGAYVPLLPPPGGPAPVTVTAYDAAGAVLASRSQ